MGWVYTRKVMCSFIVMKLVKFCQTLFFFLKAMPVAFFSCSPLPSWFFYSLHPGSKIQAATQTQALPAASTWCPHSALQKLEPLQSWPPLGTWAVPCHPYPAGTPAGLGATDWDRAEQVPGPCFSCLVSSSVGAPTASPSGEDPTPPALPPIHMSRPRSTHSLAAVPGSWTHPHSMRRHTRCGRGTGQGASAPFSPPPATPGSCQHQCTPPGTGAPGLSPSRVWSFTCLTSLPRLKAPSRDSLPGPALLQLPPESLPKAQMHLL